MEEDVVTPVWSAVAQQVGRVLDVIRAFMGETDEEAHRILLEECAGDHLYAFVTTPEGHDDAGSSDLICVDKLASFRQIWTGHYIVVCYAVTEDGHRQLLEEASEATTI